MGATGTAALLNVPRSLEKTLQGLQAAGYDLGLTSEQIDGEAIIAALKLQEDQRAVSEGAPGILQRCWLFNHITGCRSPLDQQQT